MFDLNLLLVIINWTGLARLVPNAFIAVQKYCPASFSVAAGIKMSLSRWTVPLFKRPLSELKPQWIVAWLCGLCGSQWNSAGSPRLTVKTAGVAIGCGGKPTSLFSCTIFSTKINMDIIILKYLLLLFLFKILLILNKYFWY